MLSKGVHIASKRLTLRQKALDALLFHLGFRISNAERIIRLGPLLRHFQGIPGGSVAIRAQGLTALYDSNVDIWFGTATATITADNLRVLSVCWSYHKLDKAADRRKRRYLLDI